MKRIVLNIMVITMLSLLSLTGCHKNSVMINENYDKIVEYSYKSMGPGLVTDFYEVHYVIHNDNTLEIYGTFNQDGCEMNYIEGTSFLITNNDKNNIIQVMNDNNAAGLKEDVSSESCDGGVHTIIVYDEAGGVLNSSSGLNPSNRRFNNIVDAIEEVIPEGIRKSAINSIKEAVLAEYENRYSDFGSEL